MDEEEKDKTLTLEIMAYHFPYKQMFGSQERIMETIADVIKKRRIAILESPTRSGKTLAALCAACTCVLHDEMEHFQHLVKTCNEFKVGWEKTLELKVERANLLRDYRLMSNYKKMLSDKQAFVRETQLLRVQPDYQPPPPLQSTDTVSQAEAQPIDQILERYHPAQLFYCSASDEQLKNVAAELRKSRFNGLLHSVTLGDRMGLCINKDMAHLKIESLRRDVCKSLIETSGNIVKCGYKNANNIKKLSDYTTSGVMDIEDLVKESRHFNACPYFAARDAFEEGAQVILLTYDVVFTGETLNKMKDAVMIFDDAGELAEILSRIHSVELNFVDLNKIDCLVESFSCESADVSKELLMLMHEAISNLRKLIAPLSMPKKATWKKCLDFINDTKLTDVIPKLMQNGEFQSAVKKLNSYAINCMMPMLMAPQSNYPKEEGASGVLERKTETCLERFFKFLKYLNDKAYDGRVILCPENYYKVGCLKYISLDLAQHMTNFEKRARAIIFLGDIISPSFLFRKLLHSPNSRIVETAYDNLETMDQVHVLALMNTVENKDTSGTSQNQRKNLYQFLQVMKELCKSLKGGAICLLPTLQIVRVAFVYINLESNIELRRSLGYMCFEDEETVREKGPQYLINKFEKYLDEVEDHSTVFLFCAAGGPVCRLINFKKCAARALFFIEMPTIYNDDPEAMCRNEYIKQDIGPNRGDYIFHKNINVINRCAACLTNRNNKSVVVYLMGSIFSQRRVRSSLCVFLQKRIKMLSLQETLATTRLIFSLDKLKENESAAGAKVGCKKEGT